MARKRQPEYCWSDAWLLLAIIYSGGSSGTNLRHIISAGDYINHALFTLDELRSGLIRLTTGGFIREQDGNFAATEITLESYRHTTSPRRAALKEIADFEELLKASGAIDLNSHQKPLRLSKKSYDKAVKEYADSF